MSKAYIRAVVFLALLLVLIAAAMPTLASSATPQRQAPGWHELVTSFSPSGRTDHTMAYDIGREVVTVFGGANSIGTILGDLWELSSHTLDMWRLDEAGWTEVVSENAPSPRRARYG